MTTTADNTITARTTPNPVLAGESTATSTPDNAIDGASTQLRLVVGGRDLVAVVDRDWVLDERTRVIGRYGIAQVRATLRQHRPVDATESIAS